MKKDEFTDYYEILQVHPNAQQEVIEAAFKKLARKYHPDTSSKPEATEKMKLINEAYFVLSHPERRRQYDSIWSRYAAADTFAKATSKTARRKLNIKARYILIPAFFAAVYILRINPKIATILLAIILLSILFRGGRRY